jgi:hypothetical protein
MNRAHWFLMGGSFTLLLAAGGLELAFAGGMGAAALLVVCFAFEDSQRGERVWIRMTLALWALAAVLATQERPAACGADDPVGCYIRR